MMEVLNDIGDKYNVNWYLETTGEYNIDFYSRFGYDVVDQFNFEYEEEICNDLTAVMIRRPYS